MMTLIRKYKGDYRFTNWSEKIYHLTYLNNINFFYYFANELERQKQTIRIYSQDA